MLVRYVKSFLESMPVSPICLAFDFPPQTICSLWKLWQDRWQVAGGWCGESTSAASVVEDEKAEDAG